MGASGAIKASLRRFFLFYVVSCSSSWLADDNPLVLGAMYSDVDFRRSYVLGGCCIHSSSCVIIHYMKYILVEMSDWYGREFVNVQFNPATFANHVRLRLKVSCWRKEVFHIGPWLCTTSFPRHHRQRPSVCRSLYPTRKPLFVARYTFNCIPFT